LLEAFAKIHTDHTDWKLVLIGDGPLRVKLEGQAKKLGIADAVEFKGVMKTPYEYYAKAPIFALSSLHEGTPNALLEAMGCGLAPVISDACEGALPYITNQESGLITKVKDIHDLVEAFKILIEDEDLRERLGKNALKAVTPLTEKSTLDLWQEAL